MGSDAQIALSEYVTLQRGFDLPKGDRISGIVPVVASTGIGGFHNEYKVKAPGVVIGRSGSIGGGQYVQEDFWPLNTTLWVKDFKGRHPRFVYYLFKSIDFSIFNVGSGVPTLNRNHLNSVYVNDFDEKTEKRIAQILGSLDNKIQLNRQTNETLEKMAQALFKSWFVDFDPVIDNALAAGNTIPDELQDRAERRQQQLAKPDHQPLPDDIRQLFPSEFELTEALGWVPMGWNPIVLGDKVKPSKGKNITKNTVLEGIVPVVAGGLSPAYYHNTHNVIGPVITASASGANAGYINLYHENIWASDCSYINNSHTKYIFSTYLFLKDRQLKITLMQQGAAQPHVYPKDLMRLELVDPPSQIWNLLEDTIIPYFKRIKVNELHSQSLGKARDTLLPKLISGELRLPSEVSADAEQQ